MKDLRYEGNQEIDRTWPQELREQVEVKDRLVDPRVEADQKERYVLCVLEVSTSVMRSWTPQDCLFSRPSLLLRLPDFIRDPAPPLRHCRL